MPAERVYGLQRLLREGLERLVSVPVQAELVQAIRHTEFIEPFHCLSL